MSAGASGPIDVQAERLAVVEEALTWLGTPFESGQRCKGAGVDCGQLLLAVYAKVGVIPETQVAPYKADWFMHDGVDVYAAPMREFCQPVPGPAIRHPLPGDVVLWRYGLRFSHGGIVISWPNVLHTFASRACTVDDITRQKILERVGENAPGRGQRRDMLVMVPKRWAVVAEL